MAAGNFTLYGSFIEKLGNKIIDLDTGPFKAYLAGNAYTPDTSVHDEVADLSDEASFYTRPTLGTPAWSRSGTTLTWDSVDITITASGGDAVGKWLVVYDDSVAGDPLVGYWDLDVSSGSAEITIPDGQAYIFQPDALGIFTAAPA
jgi:hypothetical protein